MPKFRAGVSIRLEIVAELTVTAKDQEAAEAKVQEMIDSGKFSPTWDAPRDAGKRPVMEWAEIECTQEIDFCDPE